MAPPSSTGSDASHHALNPQEFLPEGAQAFLVFMDMMLGPWVTHPDPPVITRFTGSPVFGSFVSGGSAIRCWTSKRLTF